MAPIRPSKKKSLVTRSMASAAAVTKIKIVMKTERLAAAKTVAKISPKAAAEIIRTTAKKTAAQSDKATPVRSAEVTLAQPTKKAPAQPTQAHPAQPAKATPVRPPKLAPEKYKTLRQLEKERFDSQECYAKYSDRLVARRADLLAELPQKGREYRYVNNAGHCIRGARFPPERQRATERWKVPEADISDAEWDETLRVLSKRVENRDIGFAAMSDAEWQAMVPGFAFPPRKRKHLWNLSAWATKVPKGPCALCPSDNASLCQCQAGDGESQENFRFMLAFKYTYDGPRAPGSGSEHRSPNPTPPPTLAFAARPVQ